MGDHDAERPAVEHARRHGKLAVGHAHDRRDAQSCGGVAISQAVSIDIEPCSRSRNSQSKPAAFITLMMSTLRTSRTPMPTASWFLLEPRLGGIDCHSHVSSGRAFRSRLDAMTFHVERIDHVVLRCRDLAAMVRFYEQALGFNVERKLDRIGLVQMRAGASLLDLIAAERPQEAANMDHLLLPHRTVRP